MNVGTYSFTRPILINVGIYSFTRPILDKCWDLLLPEAHLDDSLNFSNFPQKNGKNFAPVCNVE